MNIEVPICVRLNYSRPFFLGYACSLELKKAGLNENVKCKTRVG